MEKINVEQGPFSPYELVIESKPDVSSQTISNYCTSTKQQLMLNNINNDHNNALVFDYSDDSDDNFCELKTEKSQTRKSLYIGEIKQEILECEEPKIEYNNVIIFSENEKLSSTIIKKEPPDIPYAFVEKEEVSENKQAIKIEIELLTSCCDLPTLKSESDEYPDNLVQPSSSKHAKRTLKMLKTKTNVSKQKRRRFSCAMCQKNFRSSKLRSKHTDGHFWKGFVVCEFCGRFITKMNFFRHHFIHKVKNGSRRVSWEIDDFSSIQTHLIIHSNEKQFNCDICSKGFKQKSSLKEHVLIHSNKKPFKCDICFKGFHRKFCLQSHLITHANKKLFKCDICSKGFNQKSSLKGHLRIHTNEKPFNCDICSKGFKQKSNLKKHLIIHSNETPFKCEICFKGFNQKSSLQSHLITHANKKLFKCEICSKRCNRKSELIQHLIVHSNEKPFKCDICSKGFGRKSVLKTHLIIHSNEKLFKSVSKDLIENLA